LLYLSGKIRPDLPAMVTPRMRQSPPAGQHWAADTGRYASPHEYDDDAYLAWLRKMAPHADRCLFATAPDVVGDAVVTLDLSLPMFDRIRSAGYRTALVAQDGLELLEVPWDGFDALFIGGTTDWKLSPAAEELIAAARSRGKWTHMGRVNSLRRLRYAGSIGIDSVDGTILRFDPNTDIHGWVDHVENNPSVWSSTIPSVDTPPPVEHDLHLISPQHGERR